MTATELMRWMPPPSGILYAMLVPWEPSGGRTNDDEDQHAGDRPGEGQLSGLRRGAGRDVCGCSLFGKRNLRFSGGSSIGRVSGL